MISDSKALENLFNRHFGERWNTRLIGNASEPEYFPADAGPAQIHYRLNYLRSALHELAHWCIAGEQRRQLHDYGYWYTPDGRSADEQREFFKVEIAPQSLECIFCLALGIKFEPSVDNLGGGMADCPEQVKEFSTKIEQRVRWYLQGNLNERAANLVSLLAATPGSEVSSEAIQQQLLNRFEALSKCS